MPTNDDMTTPLSRRDLEEVLDESLADYPTRAELANHPTHADLAAALANHPTHADLAAALANHPTHAQLEAILDRRLADQRVQIAADTRTTMTVLLEDAFKRFRVIDDQYKDLPDRVQKLEEVVFPAPPRARRKRSG